MYHRSKCNLPSVDLLKAIVGKNENFIHMQVQNVHQKNSVERSRKSVLPTQNSSRGEKNELQNFQRRVASV
jgi:hypothetical protein